jgi:hypothetical protein
MVMISYGLNSVLGDKRGVHGHDVTHPPPQGEQDNHHGEDQATHGLHDTSAG